MRYSNAIGQWIGIWYIRTQFPKIRNSEFGILSGDDNPLANRVAYTAQQDYRLIKSAYRLDACT